MLRGGCGIATFVNPYTFVPLPEGSPERRAPYGHRGRPELLSAHLELVVTAEAPLLVRGFGTDESPALPTRPGPGGAGEVAIVPGSGLHGAIRSLHEALTDSCLRVFDDEFVPVYRQQADGRQVSRLRLAVVTVAPDAPAGAPQPPPTVRLCAAGDPLRHRLHQDRLTALHAAYGLRSGDRLKVTVPANPKAPLDAVPDPDGDWVVFLSDANARRADRPYKAAVRELTDREEQIPQHVWSEFLEVVKTADDLRPERLGVHGVDERWTEVVHEYEPASRQKRPQRVGMRSLARSTVHGGQPLWVLLDDQEAITQVRLSQIWRERGAIRAGARVGGYAPCTDPDRLCPACRLFGSADVGGRGDGATQQRSYRGHVRFADAVATAPVQGRPVVLPPLGQPRPGSGQFYLQNPPAAVGNADRDIPLRQWGSAADRGREPRRIRGRKFYWHTVPPPGELPRRATARPGQAEAMTAPAVLFPAGTTFRATVVAVDVDREQLGALLAALDPSTVLGQPDALVHLGGGRPVGFGSCRIRVDEQASRVWLSASRYGAQPDVDGLLAQSRDAFAAHRSRYRATWRALARVLDRRAVPPEQVWYPPGAGRPGDESYDAGFEFWMQSAGKELTAPKGETGRWGHPLTVLPAATDDPALPVVPTSRPARLPQPRRYEP